MHPPAAAKVGSEPSIARRATGPLGRITDKAVKKRVRIYGPVIARGRWNRGTCPICERRTVFTQVGPHLRNDYRCLRCHSVPRQRALLLVLSECFPDWRARRIYEAGGSGPSSDKLRRECPGYVSSHYHPTWGRGTVRDGERAEDLEALTFESGSFDLVITQDVLEHILRPELAFAEIARVLVPGGAHVFSVPLFPHPATVVRAEPSCDGGVTHLLEPDFHKDPVDPQGSLVVREWSADIADFIHRHSGMATTIHTVRDRRVGIDGGHRDILVSRTPR